MVWAGGVLKGATGRAMAVSIPESIAKGIYRIKYLQ
jgi:hypothetical protein